MKFKFNVNITQEDYIELNKLVMTETPVGKKSSKMSNLIFILFCVIAALVILTTYNFSGEAFIAVGVLIIAFLLVNLTLNKKINNLAVKATVKSLTKIKGKLPYSENSVLEFYDDVFVEITDENKTESKYSAIENVIVNERMVVIFINSMQGYIVTERSFASPEQKNDFVQFLNDKMNNK
jgi:hypothetical protein